MKSIIKESKKHYIVVRVNGYKISRIIYNLSKLKITVDRIDYINENELALKILLKDYKTLKKAFPSYRFKKIKDMGIYKVKPFLKNNKIILLAIVFGIFLLYLMSNIIVSVEVIHSDSGIRKLVKEELESVGVKRLTFKKSYEKLQKIKEDLLNKYPTRLEWIEIEIEGMNYIVRIEERIITVPEKEIGACNIVSKKDGIITKIIAHQGETIRNVNQYVKKGDILISGSIMLNEALKNTVCAKGEIYAEVWYTVDATIPLDYEEHELTGRTKKNIMYETSKDKKSILRSTFSDYEISSKRIFSLFDVKFYIQTEHEYNVIPKKYTEEEAINKGIELAREKLSVKLNDNEYIISENVLKKSLNDSRMVLEIFISVHELISEQVTFEVVEPKEE